MAKIYFNDPIMKHLPETTVLNFFSQKDGTTIFLRDTKKDVYVDKTFVYGDIDTYMKDGDYYVDIVSNFSMDGMVMGVYVGEGYDVSISSVSEPVFVVRQKSTMVSLGMLPNTHKGKDINEVILGLFSLGTTISFKRDGIPHKDELTAKGWIRVVGPSDSVQDILTVGEAFDASKERDKNIKKGEDEAINRILEAKRNKEMNPILADEIIRSKLDTNPKNMYFFLASDMADLRDKGIIR